MNAGDWQRRFAEWEGTGDLSRLLPEVAGLRGVPQPEEYHAEGDALQHTRLAVAAVPCAADERVFWAVLLHDVGKAATTRFVDGRWRAHGHAEAGAELAAAALRRLGLDRLAEDVVWLVRHHDFHLSWSTVREGRPLTARQKRFCEHPLFPLLMEVCRADAAASHGGSRKGEWLGTIVKECAGP